MALESATLRYYSTGIGADRSADRVIRLLADAGAKGLALEYDGTAPIGVRFRLAEVNYAIPARFAGVLRTLEGHYRAHRIDRKFTSPEHARRVAWRLLAEWVSLQVTAAAIGLIDMPEALFSYAEVERGVTFYEAVRTEGGVAAVAPVLRLALPAPKGG